MKFSIVIPLYNKGESILNTIGSVLSQSFPDFELIIVDDGSTDMSLAVASSVIDHRIRIFSKENGGVCSARNKGILEAKTDYVAFLDADDYWDKDYLLEQSKLIDDFPEAAMWGINYGETAGEKLIRELPTGLPKDFRGVVDDYFGLAEKRGRISDLFCSSSVVIRKLAFENAGMFDERIKYSEDLDMWFRIIACYPVVFYDKVMVHYRHDAENRAMTRKQELRYFLPYYCDKYLAYKGNEPFYSYIQRWCAIKIKGYYFNKPEQRKDAKDASSRLDYSVIPSKYKILFKWPFPIAYLFWIITEFKHRLCSQ